MIFTGGIDPTFLDAISFKPKASAVTREMSSRKYRLMTVSPYGNNDIEIEKL